MARSLLPLNNLVSIWCLPNTLRSEAASNGYHNARVYSRQQRLDVTEEGLVYVTASESTTEEEEGEV